VHEIVGQIGLAVQHAILFEIQAEVMMI
jgi:hypothetical protein